MKQLRKITLSTLAAITIVCTFSIPAYSQRSYPNYSNTARRGWIERGTGNRSSRDSSLRSNPERKYRDYKHTPEYRATKQKFETVHKKCGGKWDCKSK